MHRHESQHESAGTDSFLDVTTNIVGILIILVLVVGMRVKHGPVSAPLTSAAESELASLRRQAAELDYDVRRIQGQIAVVAHESVGRSLERQALAAAIAAAEQHVGDRRAELSASHQEQFDLTRQVTEAREAIDRQQSEWIDLHSKKPPTQLVKHYPTPISRTVSGREVHFQLSQGRVAYVPLEDIVKDMVDIIRGAGANFRELANAVSTVGPRNGFEGRFTIDVSSDRDRGILIRPRELQLVPVAGAQGETIDRALADGSDFRHALALHSPRDTTVTLWTYPDSFEQYRRLKDELYRLGFSVAGRPLPQGMYIGVSTEGSKSLAQ